MKREQLVMFMNYPYQIWSNEPTKIHLTLLKSDFSPAVGAEVTVNNDVVGKTDENGVSIFNFRSESSQENELSASLEEGGKVYSVETFFFSHARSVSFRADKLYVYTDRGVYNPGQDILIRVIAWQLKGEYSPQPETKIQLLLQNKSGKVFSGEYIGTNEFGVAATKLVIPKNMPEGDYDLVVLYQKARETAAIRIKRFVPPSINIKHDLKRYLTDSQETLETNISLYYFAGGKIKSSTLTLSVLSSDKKEVFKKKYSSKKPHYQIVLKNRALKGLRKKLKLENPFQIKLSVEDSYGQRDEILWDATYTARPYTAILEMDKDAYPSGEMVQILAKIVDIDQQPASKIPLIFEIPELKIKTETETDEKGVAVLEFTMPDQSVTALIKSPIMKTILAQRSIPYQAAKPMISKVIDPPIGSGAKTVINVAFDQNYIPIEKIVHIDFTDISGALVMSTTMPIRKEKGRYLATGEVTSPTWGSMLANIYCCAIEKKNVGKPLSVQTVGFITEGQHVTFYPDKKLDIIVDNFKPSIAPGEEVNFRVKIRGGKGEKCLGVSVVDDAVISLKDPFIMPPISHFYNPQAKVISTAGSGVLTWPVVNRNWGSPWRDIAYTDWGWKYPGPFVTATESRPVASLGASGEMSEPTAEPEGEMDGAASDTAEMAAEAPKMKKAGKAETPKKPEPIIVIRKHFPETTFWEPMLISQNGQIQFQVGMPDAITTQKLSILATDKEGYIGFYRENIKVTQPLFVRALFPATMTQGDTIKVHALVRNLTDKEISCRAGLASDKLEILSDTEFDLNIPANEAGVCEWEIRSNQCGKNELAVSVSTEDFRDSERKSIFITPSGVPEVRQINGIATNQQSFEAQLVAGEEVAYRAVHINISLPNVFPAIQAWWAFDILPWFSPWTTSAAVLMNSVMLDYAVQNNGDKEWIERIQLKLKEALAWLIAQQLPSGAWGWYFFADTADARGQTITDGENLYYTVYALRALAEISKSGLHVPDHVVEKAINYILSNRNNNKLWSSKEVYFWDVYNSETDNALSAEIFEVLMQAAVQFNCAAKFDKDYALLKNVIIDLLESRPQEPMTVSAAVKGLAFWATYKQDDSHHSLLQKNIDFLISLKRRGYWEPHWYHAYGGMVELNARILELLAEIDLQKYDSFLREGITWLLSTREASGGWHNEIGTATAVRALLKTGVFSSDVKPGNIILKVNDHVAANIYVDPQDPYLSSAKLRYVELTQWVKPGNNSIQVIYNGDLTASVMLEQKEWRGSIPVEKGVVELKRQAPARADLGEPVTVTLSLSIEKKAVPVVLIEDGIPSNAEVLTTSLERLIKDQKITSYEIKNNTLFLTLVGIKGAVDLKYRLRTVRQGYGRHAGTKVVDASKNKVLTHIVSSALKVD